MSLLVTFVETQGEGRKILGTVAVIRSSPPQLPPYLAYLFSLPESQTSPLEGIEGASQPHVVVTGYEETRG